MDYILALITYIACQLVYIIPLFLIAYVGSKLIMKQELNWFVVIILIILIPLFYRLCKMHTEYEDFNFGPNPHGHLEEPMPSKQ